MAGNLEIDIGGLVDGVMRGLDGLFTSDEERLEYRDKIEKRIHERLSGQVELNKVEAQHSSIFVAGWRPFIGWTCGVSICYNFVAQPLLVWIQDTLSFIIGNPAVPHPPALDTEPLIGLVISMLGLAVYRTTEKIKGVNK